jgi:hypothetical protein
MDLDAINGPSSKISNTLQKPMPESFSYFALIPIENVSRVIGGFLKSLKIVMKFLKFFMDCYYDF